MRKLLLAIWLVMLSLPAGADVQSDQDLIYRVAFGRAADVELLLKQGADPSAKNLAEMPALLVAIMNRRPDDPENYGIVKNLLDAGADPNTIGPKGELVIIEAAQKANPDVIKLLTEQPRIVVGVKDVYGKTLLDIATARGDKKIIEILTQAIKAEEERIRNLKSPENLVKLLQQYAFLNCANEYLNYYMSMQDVDMDPVAFQNITSKNEGEIHDTQVTMKKIFAKKIPSSRIKEVGYDARTTIVKELDAMKSDKQRIFEGVGSDYDLNKRCRRIASKWKIDEKKE